MSNRCRCLLQQVVSVRFPVDSAGSFEQWPEQVERPPGRQGALVAVAAKLDMDPVAIADLTESLEDGGEIHGSLAEHQVLVDSAHHVLDVQVDDSGSPANEVIGDRALLDAVNMPQVNRQMKEGMVDLAGRADRSGPRCR